MRNHKGFTVVEMMLALGLTVIVGGVGYAVMTGTLLQEKNTRVISIADSEFATGIHLSRNAARLAPFVNPESLGDCLRTEAGTNCTQHSTWREFPRTTSSGAPTFHSRLGLSGPCGGTVPCLVDRTMRYRWVCTANKCTALETEIKVSSLNKEDHFNERSTTILLDRRQFVERAQLAFECDLLRQSMVGVDYNALRDRCELLHETRCNMPQDSYGNGSGECRPELVSTCATGFNTLGLDRNNFACAGANAGRTPGSITTTTSTSTSTVVQDTPDAQTWTWTGIIYSTTCTAYGCDAVEGATCSGPACTRPSISCYCVAPSGCHSPGSNQNTPPGGFCF